LGGNAQEFHGHQRNQLQSAKVYPRDRSQFSEVETVEFHKPAAVELQQVHVLAVGKLFDQARSEALAGSGFNSDVCKFTRRLFCAAAAVRTNDDHSTLHDVD
jgi:hypothetical protein